MNNYQQTPMMGVAYGYPTQEPQIKKVHNILSNEQIAQLRANVSQFSLNLTDEEILKSQCNHRDEHGNITLVDTADGKRRCTICGEVFEERMASEEDVQSVVTELNNMLQTIKLMYVDMPEQAGREYYQITALLNKLPKLMKVATNNFNKYDNAYTLEQQSVNPYMTIQSLINPAFQYQQAAMMQQPMYTQAPVNTGYAQPPVAPQGEAVVNQFAIPGTAAPVMQTGYMPQTQNYAYQQPQTAPAAAPQAATTSQTVPTQDAVKVNAQLQA